MENKTVIICQNSNCKQKLKIPIDYGNLKVICPKCKFEFIYTQNRPMEDDDPVFKGKPVSKLISELNGPTSDIATTLLIEAGSVGVPQLSANLKNQKDEKIKQMIVFILGKIGSVAIAAVDSLNEALNDPNPVIVIGARYALLMITGEIQTHLRAICGFLESKDVISRRYAALAIGMVGSKALPAARKLFEMRQIESDSRAYEAATNSLERVGWNPAIGGMPKVEFY